jgi:iron complex outermembrane receptor protein
VAYQPIDPLELSLAVTYLDPKYQTYKNAPCVSFDVTRCGAGQKTRDLSGTKPAGIASWSVSTSAVYTHEFDSGLRAFVRGQYSYVSEFTATDTVPSNVASTQISTLDASIGLISEGGLEVTLFVNNLTNDEYLKVTFPTTFQPGSYSGFPNDPQTYGLTIRKTF